MQGQVSDTWRSIARGVQLASMTVAFVACASLVGNPAQAPAADPRPPRIVWAAPDGQPDAPGTREHPLDLPTALSDDGPVRQGDTVWLRGGCRSYYQTPDGKMNAGLWPSWSFEFRRRTRRFDRDAYEMLAA